MNITTQRVTNPSRELSETIKAFYLGLQIGEYEFEQLRDTSNSQAELMFQEYINASKEDPTYEYHLAFVDNIPAGFIEFSEEKEIENTYKKYLRINSLYIEPRFRRQGLGNTLLQIAKDKAKQSGYDYLGLGALYHNIPAINLYKKFGFQEYGVEFMMSTK